MRLRGFLNELASEYGAGITMIDLDECLFHTFAMIYVLENGKIVEKLNNQEFNTYKLKSGQSWDFREFRSAEMFNKTSIPIPQTVKRIKRMLKGIKSTRKDSRIIFLTARSDFDNKDIFLDTFRKHGISVDDIYVERAGNDKSGTVAEIKKKVVLRYLRSGQYRRCRMLDDDITNIKEFLKIEKELPEDIINKVKIKYNIPESEDFPVIQFFGLLVKKDGSLSRIKI